MSDGLQRLRGYIDRLKGIDAALRNPVLFYEAQQAPYVEMARQVAAGVLALARPAEIEPVDWDFRIKGLVAAIGSQLVAGEEVGLAIFLDARQFEQMKFEDFGNGTFGRDTILAWIRAGRQEDPLGKHFDERDLGDSDDTIAARVWWALYTGRSRNSAELIRTYLAGATERAVMEHLPAVLSVWQQTIHAAARKDWKAWVQATIKGT